MKYDFSKCNNLQFKAKGDEGEVMTGYLKVEKEGEGCVVYVFTGENESFNGSLQIVTRSYDRCGTIEDFSEWAEKHDLKIVPRDPETYTDYKVGDRVFNIISGESYKIAAKLGDIVFLLYDNARVLTLSSELLMKYDKLVLTDYEKELILSQELEKKKKECPFKNGDRVLVRDNDDAPWQHDIFYFYEEESSHPYCCEIGQVQQCIPYNEHTWMLLGTTDEYKATNNNESH